MFMPDGRSIWAGFYSNWKQLSNKDRQTIIDSRIINKAKVGRGRKVSEVGSAKKLKEIKNQVADPKRTFASLKSTSSKKPTALPIRRMTMRHPTMDVTQLGVAKTRKKQRRIGSSCLHHSLLTYLYSSPPIYLIAWCRCNASK